MSEVNPLVGKRITAVYLAKDQGAIRFDIEGGEPIVAYADGDCCSRSWVEAIEGPERMLGTVVKVEDIPMPQADEGQDDDDYNDIKFYGCQITTEKGSAVIDYRNSSNGYYGGSLEWPGGYFYGGVFGQNVSKQDWEKVA